ncbi:hypothetical protein ABC347_05795 [Sphingomonas sp. 1P06PA]|uniref:hypothetical protein n=1 Tax=Sphingomonas sp. 1P06PA TaxID=554121 RepID=UPI0039A727D4
MILPLLLFFQAAPPPPVEPSDEVIVVKATLPELQAAVDRCSRGGCTPRQDIVASIRLGEAQFRRGDYNRSRATLRSSLGRMKAFAAQEPIAVSQLHLAIATVAAHHGEQRDLMRSTYDSARILREHRPGTAQTLLAEMRVGDMLARVGRLYEASSQYAKVIGQADSASLRPIRDGARLRQAWLSHLKRDDSGALAALNRLIAEGDAKAGVRLEAQVIAARIARDRGDLKPMEALLNQMSAAGSTPEPRLIFSPPPPRPNDPVPKDRLIQTVDTVTRSSDYIATRWVDVGFWIRPDGRVDSVEALRGSRTLDWSVPILLSIEKRRYAPIAEGQFRIERYTMTADFGTPIGSLIRRRAINPRFERLDLSVPPPAS